MGILDKAKVWLGIIDEEDLADEGPPRARMRVNPRNKDGRPPLDDIEPPPQHSLDDALAAREQGNLKEMRKLLDEMDRGHGLRTVLRAAAALEAEDEGVVKELAPKLRTQKPEWKLPLQLAKALELTGEGDPRAAALVERARELEAPRWALGWAAALSEDEAERRRGLVDLLFADPALARTVAARELSIEGAEPDVGAAQRFTQMAHGRDCIRRFGAPVVADLYERVQGELSLPREGS